MVLCFIVTRVKKLLIFKDENCRQPIAKTREQQISLIARDLDRKSFLSFEQQFLDLRNWMQMRNVACDTV